ncbi:hypothetical protein ABH15_08615 [Methanoculleus taiwanensis]|uniref:PKD domain-containing protein n=2 Tax=Methanoculleus taiwanensis TaxID=1550565 RepID=A0A498GZV4_9EURY|nr:hypothetical protein ABH15_08615 [Methanoculleus taiwanensis]
MGLLCAPSAAQTVASGGTVYVGEENLDLTGLDPMIVQLVHYSDFAAGAVDNSIDVATPSDFDLLAADVGSVTGAYYVWNATGPVKPDIYVDVQVPLDSDPVSLAAPLPPLPILPCSFFGRVTVNGDPAAPGTVITAWINGSERGSLTTTESGIYGGSEGPDPKLLVQGPGTDVGQTITFRVDGIEADERSTYIEGDVRELDLSVEFVESNFTANATAGPVPLAVQFTDTSIGDPTVWNWSFGDGATSAEQHPVHTYTAAGTYTVNLTVTAALESNAVTKAGYITVYAAAPLVTDPAAAPAIIPTDTDGIPGTGERTMLSVAVTGAGIASVTVNLSAIGGSSVAPMIDAGNGTWTMSTAATVPSPFVDGAYQPVLLPMNATDQNGISNTSVSIPLMVVRNGDANQDNRVTLYDAVYIARHTLEMEGYPMTGSVGMVSGGEALSLPDAMYLAKHLLGILGYGTLH